MKLITAIIREVKLDEVREALIEAEIKRITVSRVSGHGQQRIEEMYRGQIIIPDLIPKIKIEIAVNDAFVDITVNAILKAARTNGRRRACWRRQDLYYTTRRMYQNTDRGKRRNSNIIPGQVSISGNHIQVWSGLL